MERTTHTSLSLYGRDGCRKYLTPAERERFIAACLTWVRPELGTLGLFLAYTGCRLSEALSITAGSIDRDECFAAIRSLKKRRTDIIREVPVPAALIERIDLLHDLDHVPPWQALWPWSRGRAWFLIKRVMQVAAIGAGPHATPKGLRHAFAIHGLRCGVPIHLVQRWLGHASLATTAIYAQAIGAEERAFAELMWAPHRDLKDSVHRQS